MIRAKVRRFFRRCQPPGHHPQCANEPRLPCRGIAESAKPHERRAKFSGQPRRLLTRFYSCGCVLPVVAHHECHTARFYHPDSLLLKAHSHTRAFESPSRHARHRGLIPAARVLPGLVEFYISEITSLGLLAQAFILCARLPPGHTFLSSLEGKIRFQSIEPRSIDLPTDKGCLQFGTVFSETYWQALTGLSWLSYSRSCV